MLSWLIHNMKPYAHYFFVLALLLFTLPNAYASTGSSNSNNEVAVALTGAVHTGAVHTGAVHPGARHAGNRHMALAVTSADERGSLQTALTRGGCKNSKSTKKACKKRKCLKHHTEDAFPSGAVPAPPCSIPLVAVLSQQEAFHFWAPEVFATHRVFHTLIPFSPDLEQDPRPPRFS